MFTIILYTNKSHKNVDHNLKILKDNITSDDEIILLNHNRYHLNYRSDKNITYRHVNMIINDALDLVMNRYCDNDDIIIISPHIKISSDFISRVKLSYKPFHMATCKTSTILNVENNIQLDKRIGSALRSSDFNLSLLIFNKKNTGLINGNAAKFISNAPKNGLSYQLYKNTTVYDTSHIKRSNKALTIIYPSGSSLFTKHIKAIKNKDDQVYTFPLNRRSSNYYMNKYVLGTNTKRVILINPRSSILTSDMLDDIRSSNTIVAIWVTNKCSLRRCCALFSNLSKFITFKSVFFIGT